MSDIQHKAFSCTPNPLTLGQLAEKTGAPLVGSPDVIIKGVGTLANAKSGDISFLAGAKYRTFLDDTKASAVIVTPQDAEGCKVPALLCADPKLLFAQIVHLLFPLKQIQPMIHPSAVIGTDVDIHPQSYIGPNCVIGDRVKIGANVILEAGCYVGEACDIGENTVLYPKVTVYAGCKIGHSCTIHAGTVIGSDGFGFAKQKERWIKVPHVAAVRIGDRVEIGANTTIDRGVIEDTEIGSDVIMDNQIQIGHNVKIGDGTAIAACVGIAGSTKVGKHCLIGGSSNINGHIEIADKVNLVGCSNVAQSITESGFYGSATTITDMKKWKKNMLRFHQLDEMAVRLLELEKKVLTD